MGGAVCARCCPLAQRPLQRWGGRLQPPPACDQAGAAALQPRNSRPCQGGLPHALTQLTRPVPLRLSFRRLAGDAIVLGSCPGWPAPSRALHHRAAQEGRLGCTRESEGPAQWDRLAVSHAGLGCCFTPFPGSQVLGSCLASSPISQMKPVLGDCHTGTNRDASMLGTALCCSLLPAGGKPLQSQAKRGQSWGCASFLSQGWRTDPATQRETSVT